MSDTVVATHIATRVPIIDNAGFAMVYSREACFGFELVYQNHYGLNAIVYPGQYGKSPREGKGLDLTMSGDSPLLMLGLRH